jgi:hypothetical protein
MTRRPDRQIVLEGQPRPFVTTDGMAARFRPAEAAPAQAAARRTLRRNALVWLHSEGILHRHQVLAGQEIERIFAVITAGAGASLTARYGRITFDRAASGDDLPPGLRAAYADRYAPWRAWAGALAATPAKSVADLTILVCVDDLGPRQVAEAMRMDQRTVKRRLQDSLHWYARHAGWVEERNA